MKTREDSRWQNLVSLAAPACAGDDAPPYGFVTATMARLRAETRQTELMERIGLRALFASLGILLCTAGLTVMLSYLNRGDLEPGLRNIVQVENMQFS